MSANNLSLGTWFSDGVRVGPEPGQIITNATVPVTSSPLNYPSVLQTPQMLKYGPGVLVAPDYRQILSPIVLSTDSADLPDTAIMTLTNEASDTYGVLQVPTAAGDGWTIEYNPKTGDTELVLDYGRALGAYIDDTQDDPIGLQINGWDDFGNPMTKMFGGVWAGSPYEFQAQGHYSPSRPGFLPEQTTSSAAFKRITFGYLMGTLSPGVTVYLYVTPCFGLDYFLTYVPDFKTAFAANSAEPNAYYNDIGILSTGAEDALSLISPLGTVIPGTTVEVDTPYLNDRRGSYYISSGLESFYNDPEGDPSDIVFGYGVSWGDVNINRLAADGVWRQSIGGPWQPLQGWQQRGYLPYYSSALLLPSPS